MSKAKKFTGAAEEWESGKLGQEEEFVQRANKKHEAALDEALGLQMISVRLPKALIADLKFIATAHGIGYQPLMRDAIKRFADAEKKRIMGEVLERLRLEAQVAEAEAAKDARAAKKPRKVA